jgi:hypothetical protein
LAQIYFKVREDTLDDKWNFLSHWLIWKQAFNAEFETGVRIFLSPTNFDSIQN